MGGECYVILRSKIRLAEFVLVRCSKPPRKFAFQCLRFPEHMFNRLIPFVSLVVILLASLVTSRGASAQETASGNQARHFATAFACLFINPVISLVDEVVAVHEVCSFTELSKSALTMPTYS